MAEPANGDSQLTILIDNYDSFTYNIYQYLAELGANVKVYRNNQVTVDELVRLSPVNIVISPGPGTPAESGISKDVIRHFGGKIPILGVCLGHQAIIEVYGGIVERASVIMHGKVSYITHDSKGLFHGVPTPFRGTRYHSLCGRPSSLTPPDNPSCPLEISARVEHVHADSDLAKSEEEHEDTIMGVRHTIFTVEGVQFHPESITTEHGKRILGNFLSVRGGTWSEAQVKASPQLESLCRSTSHC